MPESCLADADTGRRARLLVHFGLQGCVFGGAYAFFYWCIGHNYGALIIIICTAFFAAVPWLLRRTGALDAAGHLLVGTMVAGFTQLTLIEGGIHSHAVAWLASVPLCALLVIGVRAAGIWAALCFLICGSIGAAAIAGITLEPVYDRRFIHLVDAAGNLGIILFLFALGLGFELNRATAFLKMRASLEKLAESNAELAHLNNEKTDFLGIAAHDLRNPLSAIIGFASILENHDAPRVQHTAGIISKAGNQMLQLIKDLLDANAIEQGHYASDIHPHELRDLVATSIEHNQHSAEHKGTELALQDGPACWAEADSQAALQVLDNLVSNALKYSPPGSRVSLQVRPMGEWSEVCICDRGPGISEADQQKLFRKHTTLSARPTGGESSVGLGLSIVKRLAEAMGGSVRCESRLGEGATFILRLRGARADSTMAPLPRIAHVVEATVALAGAAPPAAQRG